MSKKEPPRVEIQMAMTGAFRVLIFVVFPLGYIYHSYGTLPWPMLVWAALMLFLALHNVAKEYLYKTETTGRPFMDVDGGVGEDE